MRAKNSTKVITGTVTLESFTKSPSGAYTARIVIPEHEIVTLEKISVAISNAIKNTGSEGWLHAREADVWGNCPASWRGLIDSIVDVNIGGIAGDDLLRVSAMLNIAEYLHLEGVEELRSIRNTMQPGEPTKKEENFATATMSALAAIIADADKGSQIRVNQRLWLENVVPGLVAFAPVVIFSGNTLEVIDLNPKGPYNPAFSVKLHLLAFGALQTFGSAASFKTVKLRTITATNGGAKEGCCEMTPDDLILWTAQHIRFSAIAAALGHNHHSAGEWCRYCCCGGCLAFDIYRKMPIPIEAPRSMNGITITAETTANTGIVDENLTVIDPETVDLTGKACKASISFYSREDGQIKAILNNLQIP